MKQFILPEGSYLFESITEKKEGENPEIELIFEFKFTSQEVEKLKTEKILNLHGLEFCLKNEKLEITTKDISGVVINIPNGNQYRIEEYIPNEIKKKYFLYNITDLEDKR